MNTTRRHFLTRSVGALAAAGAMTGPTSLTRRLRAAAPESPLSPANEKIQRSRAAALAILKPAARDLEHGLALHADAIVFESYGFCPRAAIDGTKLQEAVDTGASAAELVDLREDMTMTRMATNADEKREFLEAMRAAGVTCIFQNAGEEGNDPLRLMKRLARYTFTTDVLREQMFKAVGPDDIVAAKKTGRLCLYFSGNGVPLPQQWESTRDELRYIRVFQQLGIRMMHLTYNRRNPLGDGAGEPRDGGLSDFGREAVLEMNRRGVIIDVAHSGWTTSLNAAQTSQKPLVASHTTCAALHRHIRSKPDEVIQAICDTDGLIGICAIPRFLGGAGDIHRFLDHIDYAVKKFGPDHVAIGTDVAYVSRNDETERAKLQKRANNPSPLSLTSARWEHLWPKDDFQAAPLAEQSLAWTNWPLFTVGMVQRGHSDETIRKILGGNALRVAQANWSA